jgi:hypothetical protein
MGLLVPPQPVLDGRAQRGELDVPLPRFRRQQLNRLEQRRAARLELADRAQRRGESDTHLDLTLVVGRAQKAKRRLEPADCHRRSARRRGATRFEQQRDRLLVALLRRLLDVVGLLRGGGASRGELPRRARVSGEPPTAADRARAARRARRAPRVATALRLPTRDPDRRARPPPPRTRAALALCRTATRAPRRATQRRPQERSPRTPLPRRSLQAPRRGCCPRPAQAARGRTGCRRRAGRSRSPSAHPARPATVLPPLR